MCGGGRLMDTPAYSDLPCLARIERAHGSLPETARQVADYVLQHPAESVGLSITELARLSQVSETTVLRFGRALGYRGYRQFALALASSATAHPEPLLMVDIEESDDATTVVRKVFAAEGQALADAWQTLDAQQWQRAVDALARARRVHCYAVGSSGLIAMEASYRFVRLGMDAYASTDPIQIAIQASRLTAQDVAIGFSQTGRTRDTVEGLRAAHEAGATTICITARPHAPIVGASDIALVLLEPHTAYRGALLDSKIAELTLVDALSTCLARQGPAHSPGPVEEVAASIERMFLKGSPSRAQRRKLGPQPADHDS